MDYVMLNEYFLQQRKLVEQNVAKARFNYDVDAIHDYRVAIKRIRALLSLVELLSGGSFNARYNAKVLRPLFKAGGAIRDAQVQQQLITRYAHILNKNFSAYFDAMKQRENDALHQFDEIIDNFETAKFDSLTGRVTYLIWVLDSKQIKYGFATYIKRTFAYILHFLQNISDDEMVHNLRRTIKELSYVTEFIKQRDNWASHVRQTVKDIKQLGEDLGAWHDRVVMLEMLEMLKKQPDTKPIFDNHDIVLLEHTLQAHNKQVTDTLVRRLQHHNSVMQTLQNQIIEQ